VLIEGMRSAPHVVIDNAEEDSKEISHRDTQLERISIPVAPGSFFVRWALMHASRVHELCVGYRGY